MAFRDGPLTLVCLLNMFVTSHGKLFSQIRYDLYPFLFGLDQSFLSKHAGIKRNSLASRLVELNGPTDAVRDAVAFLYAGMTVIWHMPDVGSLT